MRDLFDGVPRRRQPEDRAVNVWAVGIAALLVGVVIGMALSAWIQGQREQARKQLGLTPAGTPPPIQVTNCTIEALRACRQRAKMEQTK